MSTEQIRGNLIGANAAVYARNSTEFLFIMKGGSRVDGIMGCPQPEKQRYDGIKM